MILFPINIIKIYFNTNYNIIIIYKIYAILNKYYIKKNSIIQHTKYL